MKAKNNCRKTPAFVAFALAVLGLITSGKCQGEHSEGNALLIKYSVGNIISAEGAKKFGLPAGTTTIFYQIYINAVGYRVSLSDSADFQGDRWFVQCSNTVYTLANNVRQQFSLSDAGGPSSVAGLVECRSYLSDLERYVVPYLKLPPDISVAVTNWNIVIDDSLAKGAPQTLARLQKRKDLAVPDVKWVGNEYAAPFEVEEKPVAGCSRKVKVLSVQTVNENADPFTALMAPLNAATKREVTHVGNQFLEGTNVINAQRIDDSINPAVKVQYVRLIIIAIFAIIPAILYFSRVKHKNK